MFGYGVEMDQHAKVESRFNARAQFGVVEEIGSCCSTASADFCIQQARHGLGFSFTLSILLSFILFFLFFFGK